jgi:hypothetical protein
MELKNVAIKISISEHGQKQKNMSFVVWTGTRSPSSYFFYFAFENPPGGGPRRMSILPVHRDFNPDFHVEIRFL